MLNKIIHFWCLSVPGKSGLVTRPNKVKVRAFDENMEEFELVGEEFLASITTICFKIPTWGAARPTPPVSYIVSNISAINCFNRGRQDFPAGRLFSMILHEANLDSKKAAKGRVSEHPSKGSLPLKKHLVILVCSRLNTVVIRGVGLNTGHGGGAVSRGGGQIPAALGIARKIPVQVPVRPGIAPVVLRPVGVGGGAVCLPHHPV